MNLVDDKILIDSSDLCKILTITKPTLIRWRKKGLPCYKGQRAIRFDLNEVLYWLKKGETNGKTDKKL
jgi:phage terminase Nu1 subunit (DNA packaging protein)